MTGFRIREEKLLALGMTLPGLQPRARAIGELPALGVLTLAGMLPEDWTCSYRGVQHWDESFVDRVLDERPTLVAMSALTASVEEAYRLSRRLRREGLRVVIGGLHATACPAEAAEHCDAVVVGAGEAVWRQVLAHANAGPLKPIYRTPRQFVPSEWSQPRWDLLGGAAPPRFTLQTQRGCPLACDFCGASRLLGRFQEKPLAAIQRELSAIAQLQSRPLIELADDNTFAGGRDPQLLFEALRRVGARYFTEADWRIGFRPEVLRGLADSGCAQVLVGIESTVLRYPGMGEKGAEWHRMLEAIERIQDAGVPVNGCFIAGAQGETRQSLDRLTRLLLDSPLAEIQITLQTPFPGTSLHRRLKGQGRLLADRGWSHYTLFDVAYQPDSLSVAELERGFRDVVQAVFSPHATARRNEIRKTVLRRRRFASTRAAETLEARL